MPVRLGRFEMPKRLTREDATATPTYAKFIAEPFEAGYGHTIGNSLRRVLLSSLEGAGISSVKIEGAPHEFTSIPGVVEDVTDIVLNLKKVLLKSHSREPHVVLSLGQQGRRGHGRATSRATRWWKCSTPTSTSARSTRRCSSRPSWKSKSAAASARPRRTRSPSSRSA